MAALSFVCTASGSCDSLLRLQPDSQSVDTSLEGKIMRLWRRERAEALAADLCESEARLPQESQRLRGFALYSCEQDAHAQRRLAMVSGLRTAIERDQLVVYYQPTVDLRRRRVASTEALVRSPPARRVHSAGRADRARSATGCSGRSWTNAAPGSSRESGCRSRSISRCVIFTILVFRPCSAASSRARTWTPSTSNWRSLKAPSWPTRHGPGGAGPFTCQRAPGGDR